MDELISQIRGTQAREEDKEGSIPKDESSRAHNGVSGDLAIEDPQDPFDQEEVEVPLCGKKDTGDAHDLTSSQAPASLHIMKLDFDVLSQVKKESQVEIDIERIKDSKKYKVEGIFAGIIKKLSAFGSDTACLELVDESGSICGSCPLSAVDEFGLKVGTIILLSKCSLWKINGNHLNIAGVNIMKVV
ncbi:hypothetical protein [Encephalitozoon cuniculi GB-M1]|uniref:Uncharacterized protein n=1 Tax=Encephalitozoon cuniculi (strain GB-M1) TaxID=284813 RepID=Q8SV77_ENCCU|nr:uncharacterized protein ECU06_1370 [Encephalitozoon cuniculi GB-M1]CAD25497.1 hypothetical protein [Encephalitozoon cuniculi GB-M1]